MSNDVEVNLGYDLGGVENESGDSEQLPQGSYLSEIIRITKIEAKPEQDKGAQLVVAMKVIAADRKENEKFAGAEHVDFVSLLVQANFRVKQLSDAAFGRAVSGTTLKLGDFIGKRLVVRVAEEVYQGVKRSKVQRYAPLSKWRGDAPVNAPTPPAPANSSPPAGAPAGKSENVAI